MVLTLWLLCSFWCGSFLQTSARETETYYLDEICGNTIDMQALGTQSGRLLLRRPEIGLINFNCVVFIRAPEPRRLIIKVTGLDVVAPFGCARDYIQFFDGMTSASPLSNAICGYTPPDVAFITTQTSATMVFAKKLDYMNDQFEVVFTAYKKGPCDSDEYRCHNGLCIANHLYCDGYDNCGDGSDMCPISIGGIVGIAIAIAIVLIIVALVVAVVVQRRRRQKLEKWHRLHNSYSFNGSSTMSLPRVDYSLPRSIRSFREVSLSGSGKDYAVPGSHEDLYASIMKDRDNHKLHILNASSLPRDTHPPANGSFGHVVSFRSYPAPVPRLDEELHRASPQPNGLSHGFFFRNSGDNDSTELKSCGEDRAVRRHHSSRSATSNVTNKLERNHVAEIPIHNDKSHNGRTARETEEQMVELDIGKNELEEGLKDGSDIYFHNDTTALKTDRSARGSFDLVRL